MSSNTHSERMRGIRQRGTEAERIVSELLEAIGHRYERNPDDLPGRPDLVNRRARKAIFVHGCFWHRHQGCVATTTPKSNVDYWLRKFEANVARDREKETALQAMGYDIAIVWECETKRGADLSALKDKLSRFIGSNVSNARAK